MLHKDYDRKGSAEKKSLVVSLYGLGAKMNWLQENRQMQNNFNLNSDFEKQDSEGSQSRQMVKCGHGSRGARNQESLSWRRPAAS
jgi:hypothetical protein